MEIDFLNMNLRMEYVDKLHNNYAMRVETYWINNKSKRRFLSNQTIKQTSYLFNQMFEKFLKGS